jgi:hypothetical protein
MTVTRVEPGANTDLGHRLEAGQTIGPTRGTQTRDTGRLLSGAARGQWADRRPGGCRADLGWTPTPPPVADAGLAAHRVPRDRRVHADQATVIRPVVTVTAGCLVRGSPRTARGDATRDRDRIGPTDPRRRAAAMRTEPHSAGPREAHGPAPTRAAGIRTAPVAATRVASARVEPVRVTATRATVTRVTRALVGVTPARPTRAALIPAEPTRATRRLAVRTRAAPTRTALTRTAPMRTGHAPEGHTQEAAERAAAQRAARDQAVPGRAVPDQTVPGQATPERAAPGPTALERRAPERAVLGRAQRDPAARGPAARGPRSLGSGGPCSTDGSASRDSRMIR